MKMLGYIISAGIWGLFSLIIIPAINSIESLAWQIVFGILWMLTLFTSFIIYDLESKEEIRK